MFKCCPGQLAQEQCLTCKPEDDKRNRIASKEDSKPMAWITCFEWW